MADSSGGAEGFAGLRVIAFESRRADEMRKLILRLGGEPLVAPSMREVPLSDQEEAFRFARRLFAGTIDLLILLTGVGTRTLIQALATKHPHADVVTAFSRLTLVARGPKPIVALAEVGLKPAIVVPEPNTWRDILTALDAKVQLKGLHVAVQEYGVTNEALLDGLTTRGAEVIRVPVYGWALPEDVGPLRQAVQAVCEGRAEVLLFTSAVQVRHVLQIAQELGLEPAFRQATRRCVIASVGPVCTEALEHNGLQVDLEPAHPKLGSLLSEAGRRSRSVLQHKRDN